MGSEILDYSTKRIVNETTERVTKEVTAQVTEQVTAQVSIASKLETIFSFLKKGLITLQDAADETKLSPAELTEKLTQAGYVL